MDPTVASYRALRTVNPPADAGISALHAFFPEAVSSGSGTPPKFVIPSFTPSMSISPVWLQSILYGCHVRVGVLDIWAEGGLVLLASMSLGIPYSGCVSEEGDLSSYRALKTLDPTADVTIVSESAPLDKPYDCVMSILTKSKYAKAFCYAALQAWGSLQPGGFMVLVMRPAAFEVMRGMMPIGHREIDAPDEKKRLYIWKKPIHKLLGNKTRRHKASGAGAP